MFSLVSLLVAAALVSLQCSSVATATIDHTRNSDNNLQPKVVPAPKPPRLRKYVNIWQPPPETVQFVPGTRLQLECVVMGHPAPTVQWLKNGAPASEYDDETNEIMTAHPSSLAQLNSKLVVSSASVGDVFTCVATSGLKQATASTTVESVEAEDVVSLQDLFQLPSKPIITEYYSDLFQELGSDVILPCRVQSDTKVQLFWYDNQNNLVYGDPRIRILPSGDLLISSVRWSDMGGYSCSVKNAFGKDYTETFLYPVMA